MANEKPVKRQRRLGVLKERMTAQELVAFTEAVEAPLSPADQAALEGQRTDSLGISLPRSTAADRAETD